MTELEYKLRAEETSVLQQKLHTSSLVEEAAAIAARVLVERGAAVPTPRTEEEAGAIERHAMRRSTAKFGAVVLWLLCVWAFGLYEPEKHYVLLASFLPVAALVGLYRGR